jgi:hypothetical protein
MVATRRNTSESNSQGHRGNALEGIARTVGKLISIQTQIFAIKVKSAVTRFVVGTLLLLATLGLLVVAVIFFDIGLFHLMTDVWGIRVVWAALIFTLIHLLGAVGLALAARSVLRNVNQKDSGGSHENGKRNDGTDASAR